MVETTQVSITTALLAELSKQRIRVVLCDEKHNPVSEVLPYYGRHDCSKKIGVQMKWDDRFKKEIWRQIVFHKIRNQKKLLEGKNCERYCIELLERYLTEIIPDDETNREGLAAKVYFSALFTNEFIRGDKTVLNAGLDYGYQILLSCFNREIKICGYLTEIGIHHCSQHNHFNLSSDLMEPFRPLVDQIVLENVNESFGTEEKRAIQSLLHKSVVINNRIQLLSNAIAIYTRSIVDALRNNDDTNIKWLEYEL